MPRARRGGHSGSLRGDGNGVCTRGHSPAGNPGFPTLRKAAYDGREHHFHEPGTEAARCTSCHMPESTYMVIDGRRDHSFRVPRPDLSVRLGTPNACTACHQDRDAAWAAGQVEAWYPAGRGGTPHFAEVFAAARSAVDDGTRAGLIALAEDGDLPAIVRATALDLLRSAPSPDLADAVAPLLGDADALVRAAAVSLQRGALGPLRAQRLLPLLSDPVRFVRIEVARGLLDVPAAQFPPGTGPRVRAVMGEYQASLLAKADFPESQMAIAGTALALRNFAAAEEAFAEAAAMDPQLADAWLMIARLQLARRDLAAAEATLGQAVESLPDDGILHQSLAGVRIMAGKEAAAVAPLEAAVRLMPDNPAALTDLGTLLSKRGEHGRAVSLLEAASARGASSPELLYALAASHLALGNHDLAERTVMKLGLLYPESPLAAEARRLTGQ